ncbi:Putative, 10TM heavy-metal exporter [Halopelagius inordinatus]|uniref:Putative, 10TM heavy-metal exporter n=1 Tax=Halopelagius inordinatus TaxID=553467 RepID=A0A1I2NJA1_9EURY|nr:putative manganese transporter [Halopelagius inordinatus]SFG03698.1 Putative, 10TM heavy-metal exporter [Halopelagius inordinatus]
MSELLDIFLASVRDGFVQVSAFVAVTVLVFSYVQYRTDGRLVRRLEENRRAGPLVGALMGLTPGCGGAIVMMPLYVRGSVSFGTVVATLIATAGDSAFVLLALAPEAALYAYGIALVAAVCFGYAIDRFGLGVGRVDAAVASLRPALSDGGVAAPAVGNQAHHYADAEGCAADDGPARDSAFGRWVSRVALGAWWLSAAVALVVGVLYLVRGAPEVPLAVGLSYAGVFTAVGVAGTALSAFLYFVGRNYIGHGRVGGGRDTFESLAETGTHAAMETSFVTVWVVAAYLLYEYALVFSGVDIAAVAAAAGILAPIGGAALGLIPGCGPQIVLSAAYAEGAIPFSALVANAISQDGDALFPLIAIDKTAAVVASIYTTIPALFVGVAIHLTWTAVFGLPQFGFGVLG